MQTKLVVSSSPFLRDGVSTRRLMGDVVIALIPTALAAVWFFGAPALALMIVAVAFAVLSELVYERIAHQKSTISDLSAVVTGLLLAFNLPANAPWWMAAIGSVIAIVLGRPHRRHRSAGGRPALRADHRSRGRGGLGHAAGLQQLFAVAALHRRRARHAG